MSAWRPTQAEARALGDPTRHEIFQALAAADHPLGVADLVERFRLNHNAIRQHLAKLVAAGLVVEERATPRGRGRPRLEYRLDPGVAGRWGDPGAYERLSVLLAEAVDTGDAPVEVGRRAGAARVGAGTPAGPVEALVEAMADQGFDPQVARSGDQVEVVLRHCPFASAAIASPSTVCALHRGLAEGLAEAVGGLVVDGLDAVDPRQGPCRLRAHLAADARPGPEEAPSA